MPEVHADDRALVRSHWR